MSFNGGLVEWTSPNISSFQTNRKVSSHSQQTARDLSGVVARVFEWGGQKFDKILNLLHYAWMTDKIVRPKAFDTPQKQPFIPQFMNKNL